MEHSWLFDDEEVEEEKSSASEEEEKAELEERLYSIVHHNDLSQPLPPDLAKHYDIQTADNGELDIILKNPLEELQSEELEKAIHILDDQNSNTTEGLNESVTIVSSDININRNNNLRKKFRYSDVNLDEIPQDVDDNDVVVESITKSRPKINYFSYGSAIFKKKKNRIFLDVKVPKKFYHSDWKTDANESFLTVDSVGFDLRKEEAYRSFILNQMTLALSDLNPNQNLKKLAAFAYILYKRNTKLYRIKNRKRLKKQGQLVDNDTSFDSTFNMAQELKNVKEKIRKHFNGSNDADSSLKHIAPGTSPHKRKNKTTDMGSISLNVSPFRPTGSSDQVVDLAGPTGSSDQVVDLVSDEETNTNEESEESDTGNLFGSCSQTPTKSIENRYLPEKWTKEMIEYYSTPRKTKLLGDLDKVVNNLRKSTSPKDWPLDPRDASGRYERKKTKHPNRKCTNCLERNHTTPNCPKPVRVLTCFLCGELYHSSYSCPNKICWKCGVSVVNGGFEGECSNCYYNQFNSNTSCEVCGEVTHSSENCTDLWRSYHATTSGRKVVPKKVNVNKRKYCCNCAQKGHFSHECPFVLYFGQQISPFVRNYAAEPKQRGVVDIAVPKMAYDFSTYEGDRFLQNLSNSTLAVINSNEDAFQFMFQICGTFEQCNKVKTQIEEYVNTSKRKRFEPTFSRKRQKVRL